MDENNAMWEARLEQAAERGAQAALTRIGLGDANAARDVDDFRSVMNTWRDLRQEAARTFVRWSVMALIAIIVFLVAPKALYIVKGN